ncbi:MAG TPA: ShlB/FhaC/HecB family hemolysin secretion/activation protein [Acetobacteraceae bacterium]
MTSEATDRQPARLRRLTPALAAGALAIGAFAPMSPVLAQTAQPPQIQRNPLPQGAPGPRVLPPAPPATSPTPGLPALPPPGAEVPNRNVTITGVSVEGVSAFPVAEIQRYAQGLTGTVPLPKIDEAREAILQRYRSAGYVLTTVSASLDQAGKLRFIVTEGRIASVKLDGNIGPAGTQVLRFLNQLTKIRPIDAATLERYLLLAQDVPGVSLRAVLEPSTDEPGALNLIAQVSRKAMGGVLSFDNRAFDQTGPIEGLAVLDANSFTSLGEKTEFSYYHTFPNSQNFYQLSEEFFIGASGLKLRLYAGEGQAIPIGGGPGGLAVLAYQGQTRVLGSTLSYPVIRARQQTLNVSLTFDALESEVDDNSSSSGGYGRASFDSLRVLRAGADYALSDLWAGPPRPAVNAVSFRVSHGLHLLGAEDNDETGAPRQNEVTDFTKVDFNMSRTQTLFQPWSGASVALMGLLTGQWSDQILPPAEQFYLGGSQFTRGYYSGQVPGDKAVAATAELQLNTGTDMRMWGLSANVSTQFYIFYDWGETWQNQSTDFATKVASAGGGVRAQVTRYTEVDLEALARFNRYPTGTSGTSVSALNGIGLYWRLLGRF